MYRTGDGMMVELPPDMTAEEAARIEVDARAAQQKLGKGPPPKSVPDVRKPAPKPARTELPKQRAPSRRGDRGQPLPKSADVAAALRRAGAAGHAVSSPGMRGHGRGEKPTAELQSSYVGRFHAALGKWVKPAAAGGHAAPPGRHPPRAAEEPARPVDETQGKETAAGKPLARAPVTPAADPAFQQAKKQIRIEARIQRRHASAGKKRMEAENASALTEREQIDQSSEDRTTGDMERIGAAQKDAGKGFSADQFKNDLMTRINAKRPATEDEAKELAKKPPMEHIEESFSQNVAQEQGKVTGPLQEKANLPPAGGEVEKRKVDIPKPSYPRVPAPLDAKLAAPKPRTDPEISRQGDIDRLDDAMRENRLSDEQLAESREPSFLETLKVKQEAQKREAEAPGVYRGQESAVLQAAEAKAGKSLTTELGAMNRIHRGTASHVFGSQGKTESETEKRQRKIKKTIDDIYQGTVKAVNGILGTMAAQVKEDFARTLKEKTDLFNGEVRRRISDYYGDWRIDDELFGPDDVVVLDDGKTRPMTLQEKFGGGDVKTINPDVYQIFVEEKDNFLSAMNDALDAIAKNVEAGLTAAHNQILLGKAAIALFKAGLKGNELEFADQLEKEVQLKFENLEGSIDDAREDLLQTLADQYTESVGQLEKTFNEINDELKKSWLDHAFDFIETVGKTIYQLADLLLSILVRMAHLIWDIIKHPIRFFETLVSGLAQGIKDFITNIGTYMQEAFWTWITGAASVKNIRLSGGSAIETLFSVVVQVLSLTPADLRAIAEKVLGKEFMQMIDKAMAFGEKAMAFGEKALEPVAILFSKGPGALWRYIKDQMADIVRSSFDRIRESVFNTFIEKALKWIAGFFIPGGGFVKVVKAIFRAFQFVAENLERIRHFFDSVFDSMEAATQGRSEGVASKIIMGLKMGIVLALDFLAKQLGLDKIVDGVQKIIQSIRRPIVSAIEWLLGKVKPFALRMVQAAVGAAKAVVGAAKATVARVVSWWKTRKEIRLPSGEIHSLFMKGEETRAVLTIKTEEMTFVRFLELIEGKNGTSAAQKASIAKARPLAKAVDAIRDKNYGGTTDAEKEAKALEKQRDIDKALEDLRTETVNIFGDEIPYSTQPFKVDVYSGGGGEMGKEMDVEPLTSKVKDPGTAPTSASHAVYDIINLRKNAAGSDASFYIRGHLLNQNLGGKGQWRNMTPLSRSGNSIHEGSVEAVVKRAVDSGAVVRYNVKVNYATRGDRQSLKDAITNNDSNPAHVPVKHRIIDAEDHVPGSLTCSASIVRKQPDGKFAPVTNLLSDAPVLNDIKRRYSDYHVVGSLPPPTVNLNAMTFQEYLPLKRHGLTSGMGQRIVLNLLTRRQAYGTYLVFQRENTQIPASVHSLMQSDPNVLLGALGARANRFPAA